MFRIVSASGHRKGDSSSHPTSKLFAAISAFAVVATGHALADPQMQAPAYVTSIDHDKYVVAVADGADKNPRLASGIVVDDDGHVLTSSAFIGKDEEQVWKVRLTGDAESLSANVVAIDHNIGVALLKVENADFGAHAVFSKEDLQPQRLVRSASISGENGISTSDGVIENTSLPPVKDDEAIRFLIHSAAIGSEGFGGALVNRCGELAGVNVVSPLLSERSARRMKVPEGSIYALDREPLLEFLIANDIRTDIASDRCPTQSEATKELVQKTEAERKKSADELEDAQQKLDDLKKQAEDAKEKARKAKAEAEARRKEAERIKEDADATQEEKEEAEQAADKAEEIAEEASIQISEYVTQVEKQTALIAELEGQIARAKKRLYYALAGGVGAVLLVGGILLLLLGKRGKKLKSTEEDLAYARDELSQSFPDIECRGADAQGAPHAFRITGSALLRSPQGLIIGRQPAAASIVLNHPEVSREHVRVTLKDNEVFLEDMDTTNGTKINDEPLISGNPIKLSNGDSLSIGPIAFAVRFIDE